MVFSNNLLAAAASAASGGDYSIEQSLLLDGVADYLKLTTVAGGSTSKATYSFWVKRSGIGDAELDILNCESDTNTQRDGISFGDGSTADLLSVRFNDANDGHIKTNDLMRDPTAWQHWVVAIDTSQSTAADRVKIYTNGTQITSFATASYPSQNYVMQGFMQDNDCFIGTTVNENNYYFDGYLAEFIGIDGIQLTPSSFGENDDNGVWVPKDPSDTANISDWGGSNSFWLKFEDATNLGFNSRPTAVTANPGTHKIDKTVFLNGSSDFFTQTFGSSGNRNTYTRSFWIKRSKLGAQQKIFDTGPDGGNNTEALDFDSSDRLQWVINDSNATKYNYVTTQVFRDTTAWYHIVCARDTAILKIYVNGVEITDFSTSTNTGASNVGRWTHTDQNNIGRYFLNANYFLNGYLAEVIQIDGQILTPTSFGGWDANGIWKPIDVSGLTFGTNGFYLQFEQTGSGQDASGIGADTSGVGRHWAVGGGSPQNNQVIDTPTNTSSDNEGNYATWNPLKPTSGTFSNGNRTVSISSSDKMGVGTVPFDYNDSDGYYMEFVPSDSGTGYVGIIHVDQASMFSDTFTPGSEYRYQFAHGAGADQINDGGGSESNINAGVTWGAGDVVQIAVKGSDIWFGINNTWVNNGSGAGNPSTGANPCFTSMGANSTAAVVPYCQASSSGTQTFTLNCGQTSSGFSYTPPTGFKKLNTANLAAPTVTDPRAYWSNTLYIGSRQTRAVRQCFDSTGTAWTPDFVWIKRRNVTGTKHNLFDSVRGATKHLDTVTNNDQVTTADTLTGFIEGGFSLGPDSSGFGTNVETSGSSYVAWCMKAGGAASSNSNGDLTSSVSAADHGGFSIGTYTGNTTSSTTKTVGHGLSRVPSWIIVKKTGTGNDQSWTVFQEDIFNAANDEYIILSQDGAKTNGSSFASTSPNPTVFSAGNDATNENGSTFVFYAFAKTPGLIASGSYTGNNSSTNGTSVVVDDGASGFRPAWLLLKNINDTENWVLFDSARSPSNPVDGYLSPNTNSTDTSATGLPLDFTANGFKQRNNSNMTNEDTIIYLAFADQPFPLNNRAR